VDIRLNTHVECLDGRIGQLENVILNPETERVTYLVVKENSFPNTLRLVPERFVKETSHDRILLSIHKQKFEKMKNFIEEDYIPSNVMLYMAEKAGWDFGTPAAVFVEHEAVPAGGLVVHKGAGVYAADGHVGKVDEFLVEKKTGRITHLILREGHLWGKKDIWVPINQVDRYQDGKVYLKLDKSGVKHLPVIDLQEGMA
jgi:sporulation protein YlmC with PRC-barrel domain